MHGEKILEAKRNKKEIAERNKAKFPTKETPFHSIVENLQKVTRSLSRKNRKIASVSGNASQKTELPKESRTQLDALHKQPLFQKKQRDCANAWTVGGGEDKPEENKQLSPRSDQDSVVSEPLSWAKSGTWPSEFSDGKGRKNKQKASAGDGGAAKKAGLYERWLASHRAAVSEAQQRIKKLKRADLPGARLNASRLKAVYEQNHDDDHQDACQGKKFTFAWILQQEALVPLRLDNLDNGLPADEIDVEPLKYADIINIVHPWETEFKFDFEEGS